MKQLFIVRHGEFDQRRGTLYPGATKSLSKLGDVIAKLIPGNYKRHMLSSLAPRATQTANILAPKVACEQYDAVGLLWSGPDSPLDMEPNLQQTYKILEKSTSDTIILVTHFEFSKELPQYFARCKFRNTIGFPNFETHKGEAWYIDVLAKSCSLLSVTEF